MHNKYGKILSSPTSVKCTDRIKLVKKPLLRHIKINSKTNQI